MDELGRRATLDELQTKLGVRFKEPGLLATALRHRSASLDDPARSYERLEFLGDSVVGLIACASLISRFPHASEGELARAKAYVVSEPVLAAAAISLGLDTALELGAAEELSGGRGRKSILSDALEAFVGALYMDSGIVSARRIVRMALKRTLTSISLTDHFDDYKSRLQERTQAAYRRAPQYRIVEESGAAHDRTFTARVVVGRKVMGEGTGKSKKEAEQYAARVALAALPFVGG